MQQNIQQGLEFAFQFFVSFCACEGLRKHTIWALFWFAFLVFGLFCIWFGCAFGSFFCTSMLDFLDVRVRHVDCAKKGNSTHKFGWLLAIK
jgi:hypothetical protein